MANFGDLLGGFLQNALASSSNKRIDNSIENVQKSQFELPAGSADLLGGLRDMLQGGLSDAAKNPAAAGGLGAVLGSVLGGGGDSVKGALGGGVLAMLASVAMKAYTNSAQGGAKDAPGTPNWSGGDAPVGLTAPQTPDQEQALQQKAELVLKGMINAAKADGQISREEAEKIVGKLGSSGIDEADQRWVLEEMQVPLDLGAFVAEIPNEEVAAEVYAASLLAAEVDTDAERDYLRNLAKRTGLHPVVVQQIHQTMGVAV